MSWVASAQRGGTASSAVPPDLDQIMDEEFLKQLWQEADDFSDRRRIRARMYKLREKRLREMVQNDEESLGVLTMTDEGDSALRSGMIESDVSTSERETSSQRKSSIEIKMTSNTESSSRTMRGVDNRLDSRRLVPSDDEIINDRIREVSKGRGTRYQEALSQYESEDDPSFMSISKSNYCVQSSALTGDTFQSMKHKEVRDSVSPMRGSFDKKLVGEDSETFFTSDEEVSCNKSESDSAPSRHASKTKSTVRTNSSKAVTERKVSKEFEHNSTRQSVKTSPTSPTRKQPAETTILTTKKMTRNQVNSQRESPTSPLKSSTDKKSPTQPGSRLSTNNKTKKTQPAHGVEKSLKNEYQRLDKYINESIDNDDEIINEEEEDVEDESGNMVRMIVQTRRKKDGTQIISRRVARSMKIVEKESDIDEILIGNPDHEVINREVEEKEESDGSKIKIITETRRRPDGIEYTTKNVLKTSKIFDYDHPEDISYSENDELLSSEESTETDKHGITIRTVIETRRKRDGVEYTTKKVYKTSKVDSSITPSDDDEILDTEETEETQSDGTVLKIIIEKRRTKNGEEYTHRQVYRSRKMTLSGIDVSQGMPSMDNDDEIIDRKEKEEFDGNNKKIRVVTETRRRKDGSSYSFDYTLRSFKGTETDIQKMPIQSSNLSNINVSDTDDIIKEDVKEDKQKDGSIVRTIIERRRARDGTEYLRHRIMKIPKLPEPELLVGSLDDEVLEEDVKEKVLNDGTRCKAITERRRSSLTGVQYTLRRKSTVYQHPSHIIQGTDEILDENVTEEEAEDGILIRTIIRRYQRPDETVYTTHDIRKTYRNPVSVSIEGDENDELIDRSYDERETKDGFIIKTIVETRCRTDGTHYTVERMEKVSRLGDDVQVSFKGNSISSGSPGDTVVSYEEHEEPVNDGTIIRTITEVRRRKDGTEYTNKTTIKSTQVLVPEHETSYVIIKADSKGDEIGSLFPSLDDEIVYTRKKKDVDEKGNPITVIIETRQSKTTGEKYNLTKKVHTTDVIATEHGEKVLAKRTTQSGNEGFPRKPKGALNDISAARIKTTVQPLKRDSPKPSMVSSTNKRTTREQTVTKTTSKTSPSLKKTPTGPEKRRYDMPQRGEDSDSSASRPSKPTTKSSPNSENKVKPRKPTTLDLKDKEKARTTDRSYPGDESLVKSSQRTKTVERKSDSSPDQKSGSDSPGRESPRRAGKPILQSSSKPDQKAKPSPERVQSSPKRGRSPFRVESSTPREGTPSRPCCKYSPEQPKPISQITRKKLTEEKPKNVGDVRKYTSNLNRGSPRKIESEKLSKFDKSTKTSPEKKSSPTRSTETNVTESLKHSDVEVDRKLFGKKQINKRISDSSPSSSSEDDQLKTSIISYKSTGVRKTSKEFAKIQEKLPSKDKYNGVDSIDTKLNGFSGKTTKANQTPTRDSDSVFPKIFPASEKSGRTTKDNRQEESIQRVSKITSKRSISEKTTTESIESEPITSKKKTDKLVPVDEPLCVRKYIHPLGSSSDTEEDDEEKKHTKITTEETKLSSTRLVIDAMGSEPKSHDAYPLDTNENEIPERYDMVSPLRERSKSPLTKDVPHRLRTSDQSPPPFVKEDSPSRFITGKPIDQGPNTNKIKRLERSNSNKKIIYEDLEINATNLPTYLKDIEYITDITVLEKLLQKAETYEERRIIRGHIRTLKKNDTKPASPSPYKRFVDSTTPSKPSPTASPIITRRTETTTTSVTSNSTHQMKPTSYSRTKKPLTIGAEPSSPKRTSIDYGRSDRKSSDKDNVRLKKGSSDESASSRKSSVDEPNIKRKTSSDILEKSRKSSVEEPQWKTSRLRKTSNDLLKDKKTSSTESTTKHSEPSLNDTNRTRKISPDNESRFRKSSPEYSTRNRKDSPDNLKSVISPESKPRCSKPLDSHAFRDKKTYESPTYSSPEEPKVTRKSSDTKVRKSSSGDVKPIKLTSIDRDREATSKTSKESTKVVVKKTSREEPRKFGQRAAAEITTPKRTSTDAQPYMEPLRHQRAVTKTPQATSKTNVDKIISPYGLGPTDDNGLPLVGLKALRKRAQQATVETTTSQPEEKVDDFVPTDSQGKPLFGIRAIRASPQPTSSSSVHENEKTSTLKTSKTTTSHHTEVVGATNPTTTVEESYSTDISSSEDCQKMSSFKTGERKQRRTRRKELRASDGISHPSSEDENDVPPYLPNRSNRYTSKRFELQSEPSSDFVAVRNGISEQGEISPTLVKSIDSSLRHKMTTSESDENVEEKTVNLKDIIKLHESKVVTETTEGDYNRVKPKTKLRDNFEPTNEPSESRAVKTWDLEADLSTRSDVVGNIIAKHETLTQKDSIKSDKKLTGILKKTSTSSVHSTKITSSESERDESPERRFPSSERPTTPLDTNERPSKDSSKFERKTSYTEIKFSKSYPCDGDESKPLGMIKGKKTAEEKTPLTKRIVTSEITDHIVHKANTETERKTSYKTSSDKDSRVTRHQMTTSKHSVEQHSPKRERSPTSKYDLFTVDDRKSKTRSPKDTSKPVICERTKLTEKSSSDKQVTAETVYADSHHIYDEKIRSSQVKKRSLVSRTEESQESFVNRKINTIYKDSSDTDFMDKDSIEDSSSESKSERETKLRKTSQVKSRKQPKASIDKKDFAKSMANETGIFKKTSHDVDTTISHSEKYKKGENITKIYKNKEHKPMKVSSTGEKPTDRSSTEKKTITTKCYKNKVVKELEVESDTKQDRGRPIKESTDGQTSGKKSPDRRKPAGNLPDRPGLGNEPPGRQRPRKMHSDNQSSKPIKESQDIRRLNNESPRICSRRKNVLDSEVFGKEESNKRTLVKESPDTQKLRKRSPVIRSPVNESSKKHEHTYDSEDRQKRVKTSVHTQRHQSESPEGRRSGNDSQGSQSSQKETPDRRSPSKLEKKEPKVLPSEKRNDRRKPEEESYYPKQTDKRVSGKETTVNQQTKKFERKDLVKEHTEIKLSTEQPQNKKIEKELSDCRKLESREEVEKTKPKTESVERRTSKEKYGESKTEFKDYSTRKLEADKTDIYNPNFEKLYEQKPITDVKSHIRSNEYKVKEITQKSKMTVVDTEETNVDYDVSFRKNTLDRRVIKDDFVAETPERKPEKRKPDEQKIEKEEPDRQRFDKLQRTDKEDSDRRSPHRKECDKQRMENIERAHLKPHKDRPDIISPHVEKSEIYTSNKERSPHEEPYVSKLTQNNKEPDTKENIEKKRTSVDISQMRSYQEEYDHTRKTKTTYHQPTLESDETLNSKRDKEETKCEKIVKEDANTSELIISVVKEKEREGQKPERKSSKEKPTDTEVEKRRPQKAGTSIEKDEPGKGTMVLRHDDTGESLLTRKKVDMTDIEIKKSNSLNQTDKTSKDGGLHDKRKREKDEPKENRSDQEMSRRKKPDSEEPRRQKPKKEIKVKETSIEEYERNSSEKLTAVYNDSKVTQSSKTDSQLSYLSHVDKENQTIIDKFDQITPDKKISERRPSKNVLQGEKTEKTTERGNLKTVGREEHMKMSEKVTERRLKSEETERNIDMEETTRKQRKEKTETQGSAIILKTKEPDDISDEERLDTLEKEESNRTKHKMKRNEETSSKEEDQRKIKIKSDIRTKNVVEYEKRTLYKDTSKEIVDKIDIEIEYTDEYPEDKRKMNISDGKHKELEDPNLKSESEREKVKATELTEKTRLLSEQVDRKSHDKGLESKMPKGSESSKLQIEKEEPSHSKPKSFPKKFSDDIVDNLSTKNKRKSNEYQPFTVDGRIIDGNYNEKKTKTGSPKHPEETRKRKYTPDSAVKDKVPASKAPHDKTPKTSLPSRFSKSPEPDDLSTRIKKLSKQQKSSAENISQLTKRKISDTRTYSLQSLSVDSTTSSIPGYMRPCGDSRSSRSSRRHVTPERDPLDLEEYLANSYQYTRCTKRIVKPPVKYDYTYVINQDDVPAGGGGSYSIYFGPRDSIPSPKSSVTETNKYNDFKSAKGESTDTTNYRKYSSNFEAVSKDFTPQDTTCKKSITHETYPHHETETRLTSTDTDFKKENTYLDIKHQYENTVKSFDTRHASRDTPHDSSKKNYNTKEISTFTKISPEDYDAYSNIRQQYQDTVKNIADDSSFRKLSNVSTKDERENVGFVRNLVDNTYEICHKDVDTAARKYRELVTKDYKDYGITDKSISDVVMAEPGVTKTHLHGTSGSGTLRAVQGGEEDNGILTVKDKTSHTHKINQINVDQVDQQKSFGSQVYKSDPNVIHGPASRSVNDTNNMNVVDTTFKTGRDSETYYERVSDVHNKYSYQVGKEEEFTKVYKYDDSLNKKEYNYDVSDYYTQDGSPTMRAKNSFIPDYDYNKVYLPKIDKSNERPCSASNILYETIGRDDSEPISQTYQKPHRETDATKTTKQNTSSYVTFDGRLVTHETTDHSTEHKMAEPENRQVGQCVFATSTQQKGGSHPQVEKSHSATVECDSVTSFTSRALRDDVDSTHDVMRKEGRSFLDDRTKVTGISDVLSRMDASHAVDHEAKVTSDDQARSLLNKFLGAQVLMTGVESMMANAAGTKTSSHTAMTCDGDGKMVVTRNVSGEQMMKAMKDGEILREDKKSFSTGPQTITYTTSSTSPKVEGADIVKGININEVADDFELNQLLDSCEEYDERRRVRMRLKALMAEKKVLQKQLSGHEQGDTYSSSSRRIASVSGSKGSDLRTSDGNSSHSFSRGSTKVSSQKSSYSTQSSNKTYHSEGKSISAFDKFKQLDSASPKQIQNAKGPAASGPLFQLSTSLVRSASGVKDMILTWCQCRTRDYQGVKIENFSTSWNDGLAFCALIHHFYPEAFDFSSLNPKNRRHNFALAFRVADEKAGVMPLLDVEDMVMMKKPDWKCVFTYVQSLYKRLKDE